VAAFGNATTEEVILVIEHKTRTAWLVIVTLVVIATSFAGCSDDEEATTAPPTPPDFSQPENLLSRLEEIYNMPGNDANARYLAYQELFPPAADDSLSFLFIFQPDDVEPGEDPSWGLSGELEAHLNMFTAQASEEIFSLQLALTQQPPEPIEFPDPGQENWVGIFVSNVNLRLMLTANDGFLVDGGQANFKMAPKEGRWFITEWKDLPRPVPGNLDVESSTWGQIKSMF
jgi:hypothetical protein